MALLSRKEKRLTASYSNKHEISSADIKNIIKEGCERRTGKSWKKYQRLYELKFANYQG